MHDAIFTAYTLKTITHPDGSVTFEPVASNGQLTYICLQAATLKV